MLLREKKIREARKSFWEFCLLLSAFHRKHKDEEYLKRFCDTLQNFWENKLLKENGELYTGLIIAEPPGHGKTWTSVLFDAWVLGCNSLDSIINISYNEKQALKTSKAVRNLIMSKPSDSLDTFVFSDIFPNITIKNNERSAELWSLEGSYFSYMSAGLNGTLTGNRASAYIKIDDPVKNHKVAFNDNELEDIYDYYTNTILSRKKDNDTKMIIISTFWTSKDLPNRILASEEGSDFYVLKERALTNEEAVHDGREKPQMLCSALLNYENYCKKKKLADENIFMANYQQELIDAKDALYPNLQTYNRLPVDENGDSLLEEIIAYVDTADEGKDYLAGVIAGKYNGLLYILDIIYTQKPMDITENMLADALVRYRVHNCVIEGNNGGVGFSRNVTRILWEKYKTRKPSISYFHQSKNKKTRILTKSSDVCNLILFPADSYIRFPEAWKSIKNYKRTGKNEHDDIEDALTGLIEIAQKKKTNLVKTYKSPF